MKEKANYPNKKNKNKIYHFLAFRRKAKIYAQILEKEPKKESISGVVSKAIYFMAFTDH